MSYVPKFTTKDDVYSYISYLNETSSAIIPDKAMEIGEDLVLSQLQENRKFDITKIDYSDYRLKHAAEYAILYTLSTSPMIAGIFSRSGDLISLGTAGFQTIFTSSDRGGSIYTPQDIDKQPMTPNYWHQFLYWINMYLKDTTTGGNRIDKVHMMASNMNESRVRALVKNRQYNAFSPRQ